MKSSSVNCSPADYSQPDFFRFGWDSLFLVQQVRELAKRSPAMRMLELGAGSGVVTCELSRDLELGPTHVVEVQPEWGPHLVSNLQNFARLPQAPVIHWESVGSFNPLSNLQFELIVSNPPYFAPERGRPSPDPRRNVVHRLVLEPWQMWIDCMVRSLAVGGEAWFLQKDPGPAFGKPSIPDGFQFKHEVRSGPMRLICLRRLHVE